MTNWFEQEETFEWLSDTDLPASGSRNMLRYIRAKWPSAFQKQAPVADQMPQSFAHWWVYSRISDVVPFKYPTIEYWSSTASDWQGKGTGADIIAMFKTWFDLLLIDITSFEDEHHREGVPRLYNIDGQAHIYYYKNVKKKRASRRLTVKYIVEQGMGIFQERGFTEGLEWWTKECKLIKSL